MKTAERGGKTRGFSPPYKIVLPNIIGVRSFFHTLFVPDEVHVETQDLHPMISTEFCNCWNRFNINSCLTLAPRLNCKLNVVLQHWWDTTSLNFVNGEWNVWKLSSNASFVFEFKFYLQLITNEHFELRMSHRTLDFLIQTQRFLWQQKCVAFSAIEFSFQTCNLTRVGSHLLLFRKEVFD